MQPKTPYRYFKDKADILSTVRAQAFAKFADALETAAASAPGGDPVERARRVGEAYHQFALKNWYAYRIMFDIDAPFDESHADLCREADRAARYITQQAEQLAEEQPTGEPDEPGGTDDRYPPEPAVDPLSCRHPTLPLADGVTHLDTHKRGAIEAAREGQKSATFRAEKGGVKTETRPAR